MPQGVRKMTQNEYSPQTTGTGDTRQHCEHECVCSPYRVIFGKTFGKDDESCVRKNCKHDTRSRPAASQLTPEANCISRHDTGKFLCSNEVHAAIRNEAQELAMRMYSLMLEVMQENTDEFMEYYAERMKEFQNALGIRTSTTADKGGMQE